MQLSSMNSKRCFIVVTWAIHEGKALLVHHKKLDIWLAPGGHVEENELPHQAALREFSEETGLQAEILSAYPTFEAVEEETLPMPFFSGLHTINKPRGDSFCEQHYGFAYLAQVQGDYNPIHDTEESLGIGWFTLEEMQSLQTTVDIRQEAALAFRLFPHI